MKTFLSWSGPRSKQIAFLMHDFLRRVVQALEPWMSGEDIAAGARWSTDIGVHLQEARFGIICLTPENLNEPWILFETGALAKAMMRPLCALT